MRWDYERSMHFIIDELCHGGDMVGKKGREREYVEMDTMSVLPAVLFIFSRHDKVI